MKHTFTIADVQYHLAADRLRIIHRGAVALDVCLSPTFDGRTVRIAGWQELGPRRYRASLGEFGQACLEERFDRLAFWIETPIKQFERVTYLSDGEFPGGRWRTFISDEHERQWDKKVDINIPISSAYAVSCSPDTEERTGGMTDPTDCPTHWIWNVHVRACALQGARTDTWLGLSIPAPWGIGITRLNMTRTRFNLRFEVIRPGCTKGQMPVVYFCPGLANEFAVLDEHRELSEKLGLVNFAPKKIPQWWTNPWFGYWDEMERLMHGGQIKRELSNVITLLRDWVEKTRELTAWREFNVNMEQGCYRLYGDYRPAENLGTIEQVREVIDAWRKDGVHVGHYLHPFIVNTKIPFYREHPEAFCQPKDPNFFMEYPLETWDNDNPKFAPIDWTHPLGREYMLGQIELLISSAPGCRNFDVLRSNHWRSPDPRHYNFHDPDWGIGDMMTFKVQKLMYDHVKSIKPDAMVTKLACLDPYMQPTFDAMQISEEWTSTMTPWYRRVRLAARTMRNTIVWLDPWFVTRSKGDEYHMGLFAVLQPETQWVEYAPHCYYPSWRKLEETRLRRRKAGLHVHYNARIDPSDRIAFDFSDTDFFATRLRTAGPLAGFPAALAGALSRRCFVTYSESEARVASSETRTDWIDLPPGAKLGKVTRVLHDGREEVCDHVFDPATNRVQLHIEDCGKDVFSYRIAYSLGQPAGQ